MWITWHLRFLQLNSDDWEENYIWEETGEGRATIFFCHCEGKTEIDSKCPHKCENKDKTVAEFREFTGSILTQKTSNEDL